MKKSRAWVRDLKQSAKGWSDDNIMLHSSSLAYYSVFSIAPLLVIAMAVAGFVLGDDASQGRIFGEVQGLIGSGGASAVRSMVQSAASHPRSGVLASVIGVVTLVAGASGAFQQLQESLNLIWNVETSAGQGFMGWLRRRIFTLAMVGVIAFLLLVSLVASALISAAVRFVGISSAWEAVNFLVSTAVATLLFASVYKFLPDVKLRWRDLWAGSFLTALLFSAGKWLIGLYIAKSSVSSSYGAAGSLVALLIWTYYSALIFFFGAEFIKVFSLKRGRGTEAKPGAQVRRGQ